jgi:hypothetical protein
MAQSKSAVRLTDQTLQQLKDKGFQYVIVKGYTPDRRLDHIQLNHFILTPVVTLPTEPGEKEIYAPIDSEVLADWASTSDGSFEAYIEFE